MANKLQIENVPDVYPFFNAYPYPYKKTTNQSEYDLATQLFAFKDFGTPSEKVRNGFVNMAKKAVISLDTLKDTVFINMPSSKGLSATQTRWGEINQTLRSNHITVLDPSALYYAKPKAEAHSVNANGKRNMEYDVLDGLVINCRDQIQGKNVVLLDDVMTTGRHLRFIGDELMKLGAKTVSEVALCCTPPKIGHDDTRYRYRVVQDDGCKRHPHKFSQTLNPLENQSAFYAIDSRERQLSIFDVLTEKEVQAVKNINPNQQMAAEREPVWHRPVLTADDRELEMAAEIFSPEVYHTDLLYSLNQYGRLEDKMAILDEKFKYFYRNSEWMKADAEIARQMVAYQESKGLTDAEASYYKSPQDRENHNEPLSPKTHLEINTIGKGFYEEYARLVMQKRHEVNPNLTQADDDRLLQVAMSFTSSDMYDRTLAAGRHSYEVEREIDYLTREDLPVKPVLRAERQAHDIAYCVYEQTYFRQENQLENMQQERKAQEVAEKESIYNQSINNSSIMAKENPQQPENQAAEKTMSLPKKQSLSFANISPIKKQDGTEVKTAEPRFSTTIRLGDLAAMQKSNGRVVTDKEGKEHKLLDLAIVPNTKHEEGKNSPYLVIAKRNDAPAHYNGKDVKFVDKDAVMEFTVNSAQLLAKASNLLGKKLDDTVQLHIGKNGAGSTGVSFNPGEYPTVDKKQLEIATERITTVNSFDRAIKSQQNMDKMGENRYVDKYLGSAFGFDAKDANKQTILNEKTQEPVKNFNITLKATDIKFLPEADKFGNVNLAIVKRDLSPEKLGEKGLKMTEGSDFPVNERGFKQPNYMVMADPKTYKNGEPNEHVVAVIKVNKDELNQLPKTKESFTTKDGKEVNNEFIHISTDRFGQVKANVNDYKFHNVEAQDTRLTARITTYNPQIAQKERQNWEQKHPRLSEADFTAKIEREKNLPTQFDAYRQATQLMQSKPQKNEQQTSQGESQKADQQAKVYKDYSKADDANQQEQGRGKKMPF